jgi:hypothetical protein
VKSFLFVVLSFMAGASHAVSVTNGNFSDGLSGWNDVSFGGLASVGSDETLSLSGGAGSEPYAASVWQGDDGTFFFSDPLELSAGDLFLSFDVLLRDQADDTSETGTSFFEDSLSIEFYDAMDLSYDLFFQSGADFSVGDEWSTVFLDISSLQGREFALTVNLFDENDGFNAIFGLDNFAFTDTNSPGGTYPVPEPSSFALFMFGIFALFLRRRSIRD